MGKKLTTEEFIERAKKVHGDKYDYSEVEYITIKDKVLIKCKVHGMFKQTPDLHLQGKGCKQCAMDSFLGNRRKPLTVFLKEAYRVHKSFYDYSLVEYKNNRTKIRIICPEHGEFQQVPRTHLLGYGCPRCSERQRIDTLEFIRRSQIVHNGKYDYSKVEYTKMHDKIMIICPEHGEFLQEPNGHLRGSGCLACSGRMKKTLEQFVQEASSVHDDYYSYSKVAYTNVDSKVVVTCPTHGDFTQVAYHHLRGSGCPKCNESRGERRVCQCLEKGEIFYIQQQTFVECINVRPLPFDFYLPDYNLLIEYQGRQHYTEIEHWGGTQGLIYRQKNDEIKRKFCQDSGISLLEIPYFDFGNVDKILDKTIRRE